MLIITPNSVHKLAERLREPGRVRECQDELERMLQIKSALLWRADAARACIGWQLGAQLTAEIHTLERALEAHLRGDSEASAAELEFFALQIAKIPI